MSLRASLNQIIYNRRGDIVSINEIYDYCKKANFKQSNAERCLRPSKSPNVESIKKNGYIIGYKWIETTNGNQQVPEKRIEQPNTSDIGGKRQALFKMR